ncbi:MAG: GSCFA domain-containing protein [Bacteroidota bacterium]|nr:GSCFA domain protein [Odoribacter sp.]MDP3642208.1 GSCFA domain-containing protein [Bacteroidota bacterium]
MSFFTEIQIPEFPWKMDYSKSLMLMGSCFTENIGQKLLDLKFNVDINPFGILYNPESIANSLKILLEKRTFSENDLFNDHGLWNSYYHHSRFSDIDRDETLRKINDRIAISHEFLKSAGFLIITFGTAWVYELRKTGQIVSNCHKIQASEFKRFRLGVNEITEVYRELLEQIWKFNSKLKVIFTVSPIRHWKDGATENQLSKATLLLAIDQLIRGFGDQVCGYFPSYEIVMDELRDYRFYAEDMLHLSPVATDYIFERFRKVMISAESKEISKKILKLKKSVDHRPVNPKTLEYKEFIQANLLDINRLNDRFPFLDFSAERDHFELELARF